MDKLYENIKNRRIELGMSQEELAVKTGYSGRSMIAHIESGKVNIPYSRIIAFAEALDISPALLTGRDPFEADDFADLVSGGTPIDDARLFVKAGEIYYGKKMMALTYKNREIAESLIDKLLSDQGINPNALSVDEIVDDLKNARK